MSQVELCARNVSAALREVQNAYNAAEQIEGADKERRELDIVIHHLDGVALAMGLRQKS